jgi:hypothetical protein
MRAFPLGIAVLCLWLAITAVGVVGLWRRSHAAPPADDSAEPPPPPPPQPRALSPTGTPSPTPSRTLWRVPATSPPARCRRTRGASPTHTTDEHGYTCTYASVDAETDCCHGWAPRYSCETCRAPCCTDYARCVACCMGRDRAFVACSADCRTSSRSLDAAGAYAAGSAHFCWHTPPSPSQTPLPSSRALDLSVD